MIVGSGLIASAMRPHMAELESHCIYAAGVSNSSCKAPEEFARERQRLQSTLAQIPDTDRLVYFGTCSVSDPTASETPYVQHKLAMESLVMERGNATIFRLPQVVGRTLNPHTLTNYLIARIARSERFTVWRNARRYLIHADDMASIATQLLTTENCRGQTINISNPRAYSVFDIVAALERLVGKVAHYDVLDRGTDYAIDAERAAACAVRLGIDFDATYLERILERTYGATSAREALISADSSGTP